MRLLVSINEISRLADRDIRSVRRQFASIEPVALQLAGSTVVPLYDACIVEHICRIPIMPRPIESQIQYALKD
jgi:hypothetical protein